MIPLKLIPRSCAIGLLMVCCVSANAQTLLFWEAQSGKWEDSDSWFGGFTPPEADFGEAGVVNNGGTAIVDSKIDSGPGGIILGELGNGSGTLEIRSGGDFTVAADLDDVSGDIRVGQAGRGTLIVERGGTLVAESLRSGGSSASEIVLGAGESGVVNISINGAANLGRNTRIIGPNVDFEAVDLNLNGNLTSEIVGLDHSTLDISGTASLGGVLDLQFQAPFQPAVGQTWDIVDANAINGNFSQITSNVSPGPGLAFTVNTLAGGSNGQLAQVGIDAKLLLSVDRRTGQVRLQNHATDKSITIDGYGVTSRNGAIDDANWQPFGEGGPWSGNSSSTHVAQLSLTGSLEIAPGADLDLGNIYSFVPAELGETLEDLELQYHVDGGNVENGLIAFSGAHNDVVLVVDENDDVFIQNQSNQDVTINGYAILSEAGALDPSSWTSFSSNDATWREANAASNHITELNLAGARTLVATSDAIPLGKISSGANDLQFMVNIAGVGPYSGTVEYEDGVIDFGGSSLLGDCDGDGQLSGSDLACVNTVPERDSVLNAIGSIPGDLDGNTRVEFADFLILSTNFGNASGSYSDGNIDLAGGIAFPDFLVLSTNFGQTAGAAAVPEPTNWHLSMLAVIGIMALRRRHR